MKKETIELFEQVFDRFEESRKRSWVDFLKGIIFIGNRGFNTKQPEATFEEFKEWFKDFSKLDL